MANEAVSSTKAGSLAEITKTIYIYKTYCSFGALVFTLKVTSFYFDRTKISFFSRLWRKEKERKLEVEKLDLADFWTTAVEVELAAVVQLKQSRWEFSLKIFNWKKLYCISSLDGMKSLNVMAEWSRSWSNTFKFLFSFRWRPIQRLRATGARPWWASLTSFTSTRLDFRFGHIYFGIANVGIVS